MSMPWVAQFATEHCKGGPQGSPLSRSIASCHGNLYTVD